MQRMMLKSKIHRATVTSAHLHYMGSITIDRELLEAADLLPYEQVQVLNLDNGARVETYVIPGKRSSGVIQVNGAAARWFTKHDRVIILGYATVEEKALGGFHPRVVFVDPKNRITRIRVDRLQPYRQLPSARRGKKA